ncbi:MAG: FHA domain-containing protein [Candidatus Thermoplasmatota archaeon]|nr:FHA domain-containing protein [Candidatus Thermoplasmatota archaeon]
MVPEERDAFVRSLFTQVDEEEEFSSPPRFLGRMQDPGPSIKALEALASSMEVLASPVRLTLLRALRKPVTVGEIEVQVPDGERGPGGTRTLSRQAISWHLDQLLDAGVVRRLPGTGRSHRYVLDHQRLFAVLDELHNLSSLRPFELAAGDAKATMDRPGTPLNTEPDGPRLVIVYGREDGTMFDLRAKGRSRWVLGRDPTCSLVLDYDPFASGEHCAIEAEGEDRVLRDLGSSNGTLVNGTLVPPEEERVLRPGDVVTIGRSRLVFQA